MIIKIRGVTYPSVHDAAKALGVKVHSIYAAASDGTLDRVGVGRGAHWADKRLTGEVESDNLKQS